MDEATRQIVDDLYSDPAALVARLIRRIDDVLGTPEQEG